MIKSDKRMMKLRRIYYLIFIVIMMVIFLWGIIGGCARDTRFSSPDASKSIPTQAPSPPVESTPSSQLYTSSSQLYTSKIVPLTPVQCGQCHTSIYNTIKDKGSKHQMDCKECHKQFHIYRPGRVLFEEILPHCEDCHDEPHGKDFTTCMACHLNAHAPTGFLSEKALERFCETCHTEVKSAINAKPDQHKDMACSECHTKHALIPECRNCHEPHRPDMTNADCLGCHPAHTPLNYVYSIDTPQYTCSICHKKAYDDLHNKDTKHSLLTCAKCHPEHRMLPQCELCHGKPHRPELHKKFRTCVHCHGKAHSLHVKE